MSESNRNSNSSDRWSFEMSENKKTEPGQTSSLPKNPYQTPPAENIKFMEKHKDHRIILQKSLQKQKLPFDSLRRSDSSYANYLLYLLVCQEYSAMVSLQDVRLMGEKELWRSMKNWSLGLSSIVLLQMSHLLLTKKSRLFALTQHRITVPRFLRLFVVPSVVFVNIFSICQDNFLPLDHSAVLSKYEDRIETFKAIYNRDILGILDKQTSSDSSF